MAYITDEKGKWLVDDNVSILIEPSAEYAATRESEIKAAEEQKMLDSLIPTEKEILMAEIGIQTIQILTEGGLLV